MLNGHQNTVRSHMIVKLRRRFVASSTAAPLSPGWPHLADPRAACTCCRWCRGHRWTWPRPARSGRFWMLCCRGHLRLQLPWWSSITGCRETTHLRGWCICCYFSWARPWQGEQSGKLSHLDLRRVGETGGGVLSKTKYQKIHQMKWNKIFKNGIMRFPRNKVYTWKVLWKHTYPLEFL